MDAPAVKSTNQTAGLSPVASHGLFASSFSFLAAVPHCPGRSKGFNHLSNSRSQLEQVQPPHKNCLQFFGSRILGSRFPQLGQFMREKFTPHRLPFKIVARQRNRMENTNNVKRPPAIPPAISGCSISDEIMIYWQR